MQISERPTSSRPVSDDAFLAELLSMGFEVSEAVEALQTQEIASIADAVEFILARSTSAKEPLQSQRIERPEGQKALSFAFPVEGSKCPNVDEAVELLRSQQDLAICSHFIGFEKEKLSARNDDAKTAGILKYHPACENITDEAWRSELKERAEVVLRKYFGHDYLKDFQLEALEAWTMKKDCLVLAATGSGKSLCFQLPALLTGKVVVVISPLISLMHDQCMQLTKRGIAACFLGSGQSDKSVEDKLLAGLYSVIYVCPETLPRMVGSFKQLANRHGIALFAIDEAHCISKWGHDFRRDYRRLSILRETFQKKGSVGLDHDIPIMALTATATSAVQDDILQSLRFSQNVAIVRTSLFRQNLQFSVRHSRTSPSSYRKDFTDLIKFYRKEVPFKNARMNQLFNKAPQQIYLENSADVEGNSESRAWQSEILDGSDDTDENVQGREEEPKNTELEDKYQCCKLTVEYLEDSDDDEAERMGGDFDVPWDGFSQNDLIHQKDFTRVSCDCKYDKGPTIIYVPTRKETEMIAKFLCSQGIKAAAYHAKLPKQQLRTAHQDFHAGMLQVVVATIAFGMGINKLDVRYIIHYGWPQSLEAYYQEAGRAGRDGRPSECVLYCDMTGLPSLLPSCRDLEQTRHALVMLEQCFRYGLSTSNCRASILLKYFGEELTHGRCNICDVCRMGPARLENLTKEAELLLRELCGSKKIYTISPIKECSSAYSMSHRQRIFQHAVDSISENTDIPYRNRLWWRGFARILIDKGFLKEVNNSVRRKFTVPCVRNPRVTAEGLTFLQKLELPRSIENEEPPVLCIHLEGDMIQATLMEGERRSRFSSSWGRGWADPEIRKQRLASCRRKPHQKPELRTKTSRRKRRRQK